MNAWPLGSKAQARRLKKIEDAPQPISNDDENPFVERVSASDKLAFRIKDAAALLGMGHTSLWLEISKRKIFITPTLKLVPKTELLRYLAEEMQIARRKRHRSKKPPGPTSESQSS